MFSLSKIRRLDQTDLLNGYEKLLEQLGPVFTSLEERRNLLRDRNYDGNNPTFIYVEEGKPVGTITLYFHTKLQFRYLYAIIDDLAVLPEYRGKGIARELIRYALTISHIRGAYKVILDCDPELTKFYEQFGFYLNGSTMRLDL